MSRDNALMKIGLRLPGKDDMNNVKECGVGVDEEYGDLLYKNKEGVVINANQVIRDSIKQTTNITREVMAVLGSSGPIDIPSPELGFIDKIKIPKFRYVLDGVINVVDEQIITLPEPPTDFFNSADNKTGVREDLLYLQFWYADSTDKDGNPIVELKTKYEIARDIKINDNEEYLNWYNSDGDINDRVILARTNDIEENNIRPKEYFYKNNTWENKDEFKIRTFKSSKGRSMINPEMINLFGDDLENVKVLELDHGIFIAGTGTAKSKEILGSNDGLVYAIPILRMSRRNRGSFGKNNLNGANLANNNMLDLSLLVSRSYTTGYLNSTMWVDNGGVEVNSDGELIQIRKLTSDDGIRGVRFFKTYKLAPGKYTFSHMSEQDGYIDIYGVDSENYNGPNLKKFYGSNKNDTINIEVEEGYEYLQFIFYGNDTVTEYNFIQLEKGEIKTDYAKYTQSGRPDGLYSNIIYKRDIKDLRHKVSLNGLDLNKELNVAVNKFMSGEINNKVILNSTYFDGKKQSDTEHITFANNFNNIRYTQSDALTLQNDMKTVFRNNSYNTSPINIEQSERNKFTKGDTITINIGDYGILAAKMDEDTSVGYISAYADGKKSYVDTTFQKKIKYTAVSGNISVNDTIRILTMDNDIEPSQKDLGDFVVTDIGTGYFEVDKEVVVDDISKFIYVENTITTSIPNVKASDPDVVIDGIWSGMGTNTMKFEFTNTEPYETNINVEYTTILPKNNGCIPVYDKVLEAEYNKNKLIVDGNIDLYDDFEGKEKEDTYKNPHMIKSCNEVELMKPASAKLLEVEQSYYDDINKNEDIVNISANINGEIPQQLISMNLIAMLEIKFGKLIGGDVYDKLRIYRDMIEYKFYWEGYASNSADNTVKLKIFNFTQDAYIDVNQHNDYDFAILKYTLENLHDIVDNNGYVHFMIMTDASNGVKASTIYSKYVRMDVKLKTNEYVKKGHVSLVPEEKRCRYGKGSGVLFVKPENREVVRLPIGRSATDIKITGELKPDYSVIKDNKEMIILNEMPYFIGSDLGTINGHKQGKHHWNNIISRCGLYPSALKGDLGYVKNGLATDSININTNKLVTVNGKGFVENYTTQYGTTNLENPLVGFLGYLVEHENVMKLLMMVVYGEDGQLSVGDKNNCKAYILDILGRPLSNSNYFIEATCKEPTRWATGESKNKVAGAGSGGSMIINNVTKEEVSEERLAEITEDVKENLQSIIDTVFSNKSVEFRNDVCEQLKKHIKDITKPEIIRDVIASTELRNSVHTSVYDAVMKTLEPKIEKMETDLTGIIDTRFTNNINSQITKAMNNKLEEELPELSEQLKESVANDDGFKNQIISSVNTSTDSKIKTAKEEINESVDSKISSLTNSISKTIDNKISSANSTLKTEVTKIVNDRVAALENKMVKVKSGEANYGSVRGTLVTHGLQGISSPTGYSVAITSSGASTADVGDISIEYAVGSFRVRNTGKNTTSKFRWMAIKKNK